MTLRLRFGVMCDGTTFEAWQAQIVDGVLAVPGVQLGLVILNGAEAPPTTWRKVRRLRPRTLVYRAYREFIFSPRANRSRDMSSLLSAAPTLICKGRLRGKYSQYFEASDVSALRSYDLDFVLRFGFNIIRGDILESARYGIWSFHHDDEQKYRGGPPCFWEIYHGDHHTGVLLQKLTDRLDAGIVLRKGYFETDFSSYEKNFDRAVLGSVGWAAAVCRDILSGSAEYIHGRPSNTRAPIYRDPNNRQMMRFLLRTRCSPRTPR